MGDRATIESELTRLEKVQADLASIASRTDDERKRELIELRRQLSAQIAVVGQSADAFFTTHADEETARTYRAKFSRMRSAAALHQASWPAARLGESVGEYRISAMGVREANREFIAWARAALAALGPGR